MTGSTALPQDRTSHRDAGLAVKRGLRLKCPACGKGTLLDGYLRPADACQACGEDFRNIRADDGPAWATILLVGHIAAPSFFLFHRPGGASWIALGLVCAMVIGLTLVFLPRAKGLFMGVIWANRAGDAQPDQT